MGNVPGYWFTVFLIDRWGRKKIQYMGFAVLTVVYVILAFTEKLLEDNAMGVFVFLYITGQFFFNFGPNVTTFVVPGEVFPTRFRSTGHGLSAAAGKLGAILATYGFGPLVDRTSVQDVLGILAIFMALGFYFTSWIPETAGRSLDDFEGEMADIDRALASVPLGADVLARPAYRAI